MDLGGMLGGGGVPVYWARRKRGLGEAEIPRFGVPKVGGVPSAFKGFCGRGLGISKGFVGEGEDIVVDDSEGVQADDGS